MYKLRERNLENVQTVVEVFAEGTLLHHGFEILAGACDEPHVAALDDIAPQAFETLILNEFQKLDLGSGRQVGYFIQKERAAIGLFCLADVPVGGPGERASFKTEKFAFKGVGPFGEGVAI